MVSSDMVSLFSKVPLQLLTQHFDNQTTSLIRQVLTTAYFLNTAIFTPSIVSPLAPVITNFYTNFFEQQAICLATQKAAYWYRDMDDTYVVWTLKGGTPRISSVLNSIHPNIKFTMKVEKNNALTFLDTLMIRKQDNSLGHTIYIKSTHIPTCTFMLSLSTICRRRMLH